MVNYGKLRRIPFEPLGKKLARNNRKLPGPRYDLQQVQELADVAKIYLTADCQRDLTFELQWTTTQVTNLLHDLAPHHYHDSEWCPTGSGNIVVDCDSYTIVYDTRACCPNPKGIELYVKFGLRYPTYQYLFFVSCHPS
jgi:hypothetical protein